MNSRPLFLCVLVFELCLRALGQSYSIDWFKIAGGGGTSTGGIYAVSGAIGQPEAGAAISGGNYTLTGGFWSLVAVLQTPPAPVLTVTRSDSSVEVSWPYPSSGFVLQQNTNLANPAAWSTYSGPVSNNNGMNSISITAPVGNVFLRLYHP